MPQDPLKEASKFLRGLENVIKNEYTDALNFEMNKIIEAQARSEDSIFEGIKQVKKYKPTVKKVSKTQKELDKERLLQAEAKAREKTIEEVAQEKKEAELEKIKASKEAEKRKISIQNNQTNNPKETYKPK
jgi:hypothetical protein